MIIFNLNEIKLIFYNYSITNTYKILIEMIIINYGFEFFFKMVVILTYFFMKKIVLIFNR